MTEGINNYCGAKKRQGEGNCTRPAGWGTDHVGQGRCKLHFGNNPIKHGRYSSIKRADFRERIAKFEADPDPLNLAPEVALLRAFTEDFVDRWEAIYGPDGALLVWHESFAQKVDDEGNPLPIAPKPRQLPDFSALTALVDKVGRMVERIQKFKAESTITLATLNRVVEQFGAELVSAIQETKLDADTSSKLLENVESRWKSVKLDAGRGGNSGDSE